MNEGILVDGDAMEEVVWCSVVLALAASPLVTLWWWGLIFLWGGIAGLRSKALVFLGNVAEEAAGNGGDMAGWAEAVVGSAELTMVGEAKVEADDTGAEVVVMDVDGSEVAATAEETTEAGKGVEMGIETAIAGLTETEVAAGTAGTEMGDIEAVAGNAGDMMVDKPGMEMEGGGGTLGKAGWARAGNVEVNECDKGCR
ncbi:hypothetical protein F5148DRAFT_1326635 [Russula earlei]|uniref:Uncharacterized protein n=1 Tax=Russula earlei TaxID=71964 RepID=A0ACC0TZQ3_9AGAM|nr:hypothetical protein F5148DRAFT_1326635 [Russula earlei]